MKTDNEVMNVAAVLNDEPWFSLQVMADRYEEMGDNIRARVCRWIVRWQRFPRCKIETDWKGAPRRSYYWLPKKRGDGNARTYWLTLVEGTSTHAYPLCNYDIATPPRGGFLSVRTAMLALINYLTRQEAWMRLRMCEDGEIRSKTWTEED